MIISIPLHDGSSFPNTEDLLRYLRSGRVLSPTAELALIWLNIRGAGVSPPKFLPEALDLTLADLWEQTRHKFLLGSRLPAAVVKYYFKPLGAILAGPVPRGVIVSDPTRKYGTYTLRELLGPDPVQVVLDWMPIADARAAAALIRMEAGDAAFRQFWDAHYGWLLHSLYAWVWAPGITPHGVTALTWMAVHLRHDTGGEWSFRKLMCIALQVFRCHPRRIKELSGLIDDLDEEPPVVNDPPWRLHVPDYVQTAVLSTLLDGKRLPHEVIAFLLHWHQPQPPRDVVKKHGSRSLYDLASDIRAQFRQDADSSDQVVDELFARFRQRLALPFRGVVQDARQLKSKRRLGKRIVGFTPLADFFKSESEEGRAKEIGYWCFDVEEHLQKQAHQPGTPLYEAITRWLGGPPGEENPLA